MKTIIKLTLLLVLLLPALASAHSFEVDGIYYNKNGNEAIVTYRGSSSSSYSNEYSGSVVIPATVTYNGTTYPVTSIGEHAFYNCSGLTSVTIPNSVTSIGNSAFNGCNGLTSVTIPNSVTAIDNYAFQGCTALSTLYFDADSCADFSSTASFRPFYNLNISTINIGNNVQRIPAYFAYDFTELSKITIPNSVTSIGYAAFYGCSGLTSANIPNSVTSISSSTFYGCSGLTSITIPNSVTSIGKYAFYNCSGLTSITIPNSVTSIGNYAFYNCSGLTSITIPNSVTSIGSYAFYYCSGLTSINIPNSVTSIGTGMFYGCSGLTSITIPNSVTSIGNYALSYCYRLASIDIPNSVTTIGNHALSYCLRLASIDIPNSVTSIGNSAFQGCSALKTLNYNAGTCADFSSTESERPFNNLNITTINIGNDVRRIPAYFAYGLTKLSNITVSNSVTSVGNSAFYNCTGLTKVTISDIAAWCNINFGNLAANPLYYAQHLYLNDDEITNLVVPDGVETIGSYAFYNGIFSTVRIAKTVTHIGKQAFNNSPSIETVTCAAKTPPSWNDIAMFTTNVYNHSPLYVPLGSERAYMSDQCWGQFSTIVGIEIQDMVLATGISLSQSQMSLQVGGTSQLIATVLPDSTTNKAVTWTSSAPDIATVDTTGLVTAIAPGSATITATTTDGSFLSASCSITVADSTIITFADDDVKALCVQNWDTNGDGELNTDEAAAVTNLGDIFSDTDITSFDELAYFTGLTSIGYGTFRDCYNLISITIPAGVTSIGDEAFSGCSSLTSITIPENVTSIGTAALYGCSGLSSITIPAGVTSINDGTFSHCSNLSSITIPASVTSIGYEAFYHCISLMSITIPASVTSIDYEAFYGCSELNTVTCLASTPPTIYSNTFTTYGTLYVPAGKKITYQSEEYWCEFYNIIELPAFATSISLNTTSTELTEGSTMQLTATIQPSNTTNKVVTWASDEESVAMVDENGLVTAIAPGSATITATTTDGTNLSASCVVTVIENQISYDNYLSMGDTTVMHGETIVIPVKMTNEASIISFQTDIFLPDGLELMQEDGEYIIDPSERMTRTHSIMSNEVSNGAIRVLCYSSNYKPFTGNSGDDLFYITVKVADDAEGDYTIQLKNTLLTNSDFVDLAAPDVAANVNVKAYLLGDANNSGTVTVGDVVATAQYVLEMNPQPFVFEAADVNMDNNITVADVSRIAWMVLNPAMNAPMRAPILWNNGDLMGAEGISLKPGETRRVSIALDNEMDYSAFQLDLKLPSGLTASNFQLTGRASGHAFDVNTLQNGNTRALCYSPLLTAISGHEGALLTFDVTATGNVSGDITVDGIELVTTACQSVKLDAFTIGVNDASAVNELANSKTVDRVDYFNLAGQQIERPESGVTLVVTTYTDGTRSVNKIFR